METEDCSIQLLGLKNGSHQFFYDLDDAFFSSFDNPDILSGAVNAVVNIEKSPIQYDFSVSLNGELVTVCDRCLDPLTVPIENHEEFILRFGAETNLDDEDLITLSEDESVFNIAERLFEMAVVALPLVKTHPEGKCNPEMTAILESHSTQNNNTETSGDPRWDALRKISTNNSKN